MEKKTGYLNRPFFLVRMGFYFCGYPYRPATAPGTGGGTTYKGPFTKELIYEACSDGASLCQLHAQTFQPPRSYG